MKSIIRASALVLLTLCLLGHVAAAGVNQEFKGAGKGDSWRTALGGLFAEGQSIAVVIGISEYANFPSLSGARDDALRMKRFLIDQAGFDSVYVLSEEQVTKANVDHLMIDVIPRRVGEKDRFLFYWSGHGTSMEISGRGEIGYLPLRTSARGSYSEMVSMDDLDRWNRMLPRSVQSLFLLDTCLSGLAGVQSKLDRDRLSIEQLRRPSQHLLAAGRKGEEAIIATRWGGSLFTDSFIAAASGGAAAPGSRVVSLSEILVFVRNRVAVERTLAGWRKEITPELWVLGEHSGEFYFLLPAAAAVPTTAGPISRISSTTASIDAKKGEDPASAPIATANLGAPQQRGTPSFQYLSRQKREATHSWTHSAFAYSPGRGLLAVAARTDNPTYTGGEKSDIVLSSLNSDQFTPVRFRGGREIVKLSFDIAEQRILANDYGRDCRVWDTKNSAKELFYFESMVNCQWSKLDANTLIACRDFGRGVYSFSFANSKWTKWQNTDGFCIEGQSSDGVAVLRKASWLKSGDLSVEYWAGNVSQRIISRKLWSGIEQKLPSFGGTTMLIYSSNQLIVIDVLHGVELAKIQLDDRFRSSISPDGSLIASVDSSVSGELKVWSVKSGQNIASFPIGKTAYQSNGPEWNSAGTAFAFNYGSDSTSSSDYVGLFSISDMSFVKTEGRFSAPIFENGGNSFYLPDGLYSSTAR